jgi:hypothetical protein
VGSEGTTDEGVTGEESCIEGELAGGDEIEGTVGRAVPDRTGSETGSLRWAYWADGWGRLEGGSVSTLSLKPEYPGEEIRGFAVDSGSSSAGKFAESSGSDKMVGAPNA